MIKLVQFVLVLLEIQNHACFVFEIFSLGLVVVFVRDVVLVLHRRLRGFTVFVTVTVLRTVVLPRVLSVTLFLVCLAMYQL